jgi:hypothetical protein
VTSTALTLFVLPIIYTLLLKDPLPLELDIEAALAEPPAAPAGHAGLVRTGADGSAGAGNTGGKLDGATAKVVE